MDHFLINQPEVQINLNLRTFLVAVFLLKGIPVIGYQMMNILLVERMD